MGYVLDGKYYSGDIPKSSVKANNSMLKQWSHDEQRFKHRKELIQPYLPNGQPNPEFIDNFESEAFEYGFIKKEEE